jgi:tetratricopeptide (TPR) repeat protein
MKIVSILSLGACILLAQAETPQDRVLRMVKEGRHAEARQVAAQLIGEAARLGAGLPYRAGLSQLLGMAEYNLGRHVEAARAFEEAIELSERSGPPATVVLVSTLVSLSETHVVQGRFAVAAGLLRRAMDTAEAGLPPGHLRFASVLDGMGALYMAQGQTSRAETAFRASLAIIEKQLGPDHPDAATETLGLASLLLSAGRRTEAIPLLERGRQAFEAAYGPNHPTAVSATYYLGTAQLEAAPAAAEQLFREALGKWLSTQPERHVQTILILSALATARHKQGGADEAASLSGRALALSRELFGPEHPQVVTLMYSRAHLLKAAKQGKEAAAIKKEADRIRAKNGTSGPAQHSIDIRALRNQ